MNKLIRATCFCVLLFSCSKKSTPSPLKTSPTDKINATLTAGKGTWLLGNSTITFYDKSNMVLQTNTIANTGYWIFSAANSGPNGQTFIEYIQDFNRPQTIQDFAYTLSIENGLQYITTGNTSLLKYQFTVLTSTTMTITTTDVQPLSFIKNNKTVTADHATNAMTMTKYN